MLLTQTGLRRSTGWIEGRELDRSESARLRFHPAPVGSGIQFVRGDLPGQPQVRVSLEHARCQPRWTALEEKGTWVHHTEHVLAAIAGAEVDNVRIELDGDRVPVVAGGSCGVFWRELCAAGLRREDEPGQRWVLNQPAMVEAPLDLPLGAPAPMSSAAKRCVLAFPAVSFEATYLFHAPALSQESVGWAEYASHRGEFEHRLAPARSYYLESEAAALEGLLGGLPEAFVALGPGSPQALFNEVARHKLVDFIGDLMVLGGRTLGRFAVFRSGHQLHLALVRHLVDRGIIHQVPAEGTLHALGT